MSSIDSIIHLNKYVIDRRINNEKKYGNGNSIYIGDIMYHNIGQLGCRKSDIKNNEKAVDSCRALIKCYNIAFNDMLEKYDKERGYTVNKNGSRLIKNNK